MYVDRKVIFAVSALALVINTDCSEYSESSDEKRATNDLTLKDATKADFMTLKSVMLNAHNKLRKQEAMSANAADMYKMLYGKAVAVVGKRVFSSCIFGKPKRSMFLRMFNYNVFMSPDGNLKVKDVVKSWYDEKTNYNFETKQCTPGKTCYHYTQVVWAASKYLGCTVQLCPTMHFPKTNTDMKNVYYVACLYGPAGNIKGKNPYRIGKSPCAKCSEHCLEKALCDPSYSITEIVETCTDEDRNCRKSSCSYYYSPKRERCKKTCGEC